MKKPTLAMMTLIAAVSATVVLPVAPASAKQIERACTRSDRSAATPQMCGCIQRVADQILTRADQRMAAKFFADPQRAQDIRQSSNSSHEAFWKRYRAFGSTAASVCG